MELDYLCTGLSDMKPDSWNGHIRFLNKTNSCELEVSARASTFHIICGHHQYENYNGGRQISQTNGNADLMSHSLLALCRKISPLCDL